MASSREKEFVGGLRFVHALPLISEIAPGDILTFQVQLETDAFRVSWFHCGNLIHNSPRRQVNAHPNGWYELVVGNVSEEDEGEYECRAISSDGQTLSSFTDVYFVQDEGHRGISEGGTPEDADFRGSRESGLLILIDDGSDDGDEDDEDEDDEDDDDAENDAKDAYNVVATEDACSRNRLAAVDCTGTGRLAADEGAASTQTDTIAAAAETPRAADAPQGQVLEKPLATNQQEPAGRSPRKKRRKRTLTASEQFQGLLEEISRRDGDTDSDDDITLTAGPDDGDNDGYAAATYLPGGRHELEGRIATRPTYHTQESQTSGTSRSSARHPNICDAFSDLEAPIQATYSPFTSTMSSRNSSADTLQNEEISTPSTPCSDYGTRLAPDVHEPELLAEQAEAARGYHIETPTTSLGSDHSYAPFDAAALIIQKSIQPQLMQSQVNEKQEHILESNTSAAAPAEPVVLERTRAPTASQRVGDSDKMSYRYTSSSYKYSSTTEDESSSSIRRSSFRTGVGGGDASEGDELFSSAVGRSSSRFTSTEVGRTSTDASGLSAIGRSARLSATGNDSMEIAMRGLDDDTTRLSRHMEDDLLSAKRAKIETEGEMSGYSMRAIRVTTIDSGGEVTSFGTSSKEVFSERFGGLSGTDEHMITGDYSPVGGIFVAIMEYKPLSTDDDGLALKEGDEVKVLDTGRPRKWKVCKLTSSESGWVASYCLEKKAGAVTTQEPVTPESAPTSVPFSQKETLIKELVDTEEGFSRDMLFVVRNYLQEMEKPSTPKKLCELKEQLFFNFKEICDFHNDELITGIKFNAREPTKIGTTLLRLERDFDKHVRYIQHYREASQLLKDERELKEFFDAISKKIGDEKVIDDHLKLPLQRINDYQLILQELIKCSAKAGEDFTDLQRALDFMQAISQRSNDLEFITRMEGYSGNIQKFGRILKQGKVLVTDSKGRISERHAFLFRGGRLCLTEIKTNTTGQKSYLMKCIIKTTDVRSTISDDTDSFKLESKASPDSTVVITCEEREDWMKQLQASTVKSEVVEQLAAEEELRVKETATEDTVRIEITNDSDVIATGTTSFGVSDIQPRGTSPVSGEKPKFLQTLRGVTVYQSDTATMECIIESESAPQVKWLKNNVPVHKGPRITQTSDPKTGRHSLIISDVQAEDAAMYTIVASNQSGTTSCSAPFNVRTASSKPDSRPTSPGGTELPYAPVFRVKLKDTELLEGTSVRFELVVHGFPVPEINFYKDGEPLQTDDRIKIHYESKEAFELIIDHVSESDSAVYSCVAMNSEGCDSTAGCVTVTKDKVLFRGLAEDGNAGNLSATPQPAVSPAFTWFKDGKEFEASERFQVAFNDDEDTLALVFQHVKPEDAGIYTCVASTFSGKISCSAELTVQGTVNYREPSAPTIEANMEDVEVNEGASAMLELRITGWPKPRIAWTKSEKLIESGHGGKYKFLFEDDESMTLVIRSVTKEDEGRYEVVAENELGSASTHCNLHVKRPPKFKKELKDASVMTDSPLMLDVEVEGAPEPDVKWYKDGQQVSGTDRVRLVHELNTASYALVVDKAKAEDAGSYTCMISNSLGSQSGHAAVTVNSAPKIVKKLESYEACLTETVTFTTKVAGVPKPKVEWLKDGKSVLIDGKKFVAAEDETNVFSLTIDCCGLDNVGCYTVVVTNDYGKVEDSAELTIKVKPRFSKSLTDVELTEGSTNVVLSVVVEGVPQPEVQWWHDGVNVTKQTELFSATCLSSESGEYTLTIKNALAEAGGSMKCTAENKHGKADTEAIVTVNAKPKIIEGLKDQRTVPGSDASFTVKYAGNPKPDASWFKNDAELKIDGSHYRVSEADAQFTLLIKNCSDDDKGKYAVVVANKFGEDKSFAELAVIAALGPPKFAQPLSATKIVEGDAGQLDGKVQPNSDGSLPDISWLKDGRPLKTDDHVAPFMLPDGTFGLRFSDAALPDAGKYTAVLTNPGGVKDESSAPVDIAKKFGPPKFVQPLSAVQMNQGDSGQLEGKVEPNSDGSLPEISWLKDGKPLKASDHVKPFHLPDGTIGLKFTDVGLSDGAKYTAVLTNPDGNRADASAPVDVLSKPSQAPTFAKGLEPSAFTEGQPGILEAKLNLNDDGSLPYVEWLKDGKPLSEGDGVRFVKKPDGTVALELAKCKPEDAGRYTLRVKNPNGLSAESSAPVTVSSTGPRFQTQLESISIFEGDQLKLQCKIQSDTPISAKWLKNGVAVSPDERIKIELDADGSASLVIDSSVVGDAGLYTCEVTNQYGVSKSEASADIKLLKREAPLFVSGLKPSTFGVGETGKLEARVSGFPPPALSWLKNGKPLTDSRFKAEIQPDGIAILSIDNVKPEDAGEYSIVARNELGEKTSSAPVAVNAKPLFLKPLDGCTLPAGQTARLTSKVVGSPRCSISWLKDGQVLKPDGQRITADVDDEGNCNLTIKDVSAADAGLITIVATNTLGEMKSEASLKVSEDTKSPAFISPLADQTVPEGNQLVLEAVVSGQPLAEVRWLRNGKPLSEAEGAVISFDGKKARLELPRTSVSDAGQYECRLINASGQLSSKAQVTILPGKVEEQGVPPSFLERLTDQELVAGATATLVARITGYPEPNIKWYKDGVEIVSSSNHLFERDAKGIIRLVIRNLSETDFGNYQCMISNRHGKADCSCSLVKDSAPPAITEAPEIVRMTDYDCTLRWKPSIPKGPRTPVKYRVEMCEYPGNLWKPYSSGIKDTTTDVKNLVPGQDYQFRVLVESKHGLSEPSPPVIAFRTKLADTELKDQREKQYDPKDIDLGHDLEKEGCAPYFIRKEEETMYGVKGRPVSIEFWVYGLPHPACTWFFKDQAIESGGRYEKIQDRNGQVLLCINRMNEDCEGVYTCKAVNEHGEATKSIELVLAEEPHFTKRLEYTSVLLRKSGFLQCRCIGKPYPNIRWYKDWLPLATSGRIQITWEEPDLCTAKIDDSILRDSGFYSCKATNIAGDATTSATVVVEEEEEMYALSMYKAPRVVRPRTQPLSDYYDIGDELGRGTQGVTYHAVARATGNAYAAKIMHHTDSQFKAWMKNEMDMMNQLAHPKLCRMWDAFEAPGSMSLIIDLCEGGELLQNVIKRGGATEGQIAHFIRQTLLGLDYMHQRGIAHLGLTLGDILVARVNADDIKIVDFSLAHRISNDKTFIQEYGHPEFVAPELAKKEPATLASDMWSVGVIAYILLSGISPFLGEHDRETLTNLKEGKMKFLPEAFDGVSEEASDFVSKLMVFEPEGRMTVKEALNHPWLKLADLPDRGPKLNNVDRLVEYEQKWRKWYANANCRTCFRRRTLESCFYHPSKMIYPPGEPYTPPGSTVPPERQYTVPPFKYERKKRGFETENFKNESSYAQGPDTYLLQLRDTDFPLRLRQYMKIGASRSPSLAASLRGEHWGGSGVLSRGGHCEHIYPQVVIRERRRFHDMMDEEIDDEKRGGDDHKSIMLRLNKEVGAVGYIRAEADAARDNAWRFRGISREQAIGTPPFFREKIDDIAVADSGTFVTFTAVAVGTPLPHFTWFRNDCPLLPTSRVRVEGDESTGESTLTLAPAMAYDAGVFKCVARNASGTAVCRARLRMADTPGRPAPPQVVQATAREMYVEWNSPRQENNGRTIYFTLEYKRAADANWLKIPEKITNEFYVVDELAADTQYEFRVTATNSFGDSGTSLPSRPATTASADSSSKIKLSPTHSYQQVQTTGIAVGSKPVHDYSREQNPIGLKTSNIREDYNFSAELCSGRFSVVMAVTSKNDNRLLAVKAVKNGRREYDMLKGLIHRNIVYLEDAYQENDVTLLVMERLSMNVLAFLTLRNSYTEDQVSRVMKQVFDALEYLHFKGLVYCNVEPDSVCVTDGQSCVVKLVDFGSTHAVPKTGVQITPDAEPEYMAPEVVQSEPVSYAADVWSAGVLMYILLSGVSPFLGKTEAETIENVSMVRFHFEHIYTECSSEATKFLIQVFKKCPTKRATIEECYENRWMQPTEYMLRKRESCVFKSEKLTQFAQRYERAKRNRDNACQMLSSFGLNRITSPEA